MKYKFISDPGHGWLEVEKKELKRLGIENKISEYSYMNGDKAYLEEDCDANLFIVAKRNHKEPVEEECIYEENTQIRNFLHYSV